MAEDWTPITPSVPGEDWAQIEEVPSPVWKRALRYLNLGSKGVTDVLAETTAAIPELVASGLRAVGAPSPKPGFYENKLKGGMEDVGNIPTEMGLPTIGPNSPQTTGEKSVYQGGRGVGSALSVALPAGQAARFANVGTATRGVAETLASRPLMQMLAGGVGGTVEGATDSPALGIAASLATPFAGAAIRRAITPLPNRLTPEYARLLDVAHAEGIPTTVGQETNSKMLKTVESVLDNMPFSAGMGQAQRQAQQGAFNRAVLRRAGIAGTEATPPVINAAANRLGAGFENLSARTTVNLDRQFQRDMQQTMTRYGAKLPSQIRQVFTAYWDDIADYAARGHMPGTVYQATRSDLGKIGKSAATNDSLYSQAMMGMRNALDEAMGRSVSGPARQAWADLRRQYGALKTIMAAQASPGAGQAAGDISGARLWTAVRGGTTKDQFTRGAGELNDLARVGQALVKPQIPDSGTAQRSTISALLQGSLPTGVAGMMSGGDPLTTAAAAATAFTAPPALRAFIESPAGRRYLLNQLMAQRIQPLTPGTLGAIGTAAALRDQ